MDTALQTALTKFANADLTKAREEGSILVARTKEGLVAVSYKDGTYEIVRQGLDAKLLASGPPRVVRPVLASLYVVTSV